MNKLEEWPSKEDSVCADDVLNAIYLEKLVSIFSPALPQTIPFIFLNINNTVKAFKGRL